MTPSPNHAADNCELQNNDVRDDGRGELACAYLYLEQRVETASLRFSYKLANNRIGLIVLSEGVKIDDYPAGREFARGLINLLLGEADFAAFVSDAQLVDYQNWLAHAPGGQSWPLAELPRIFDPIFSRPLVDYVEAAWGRGDSQIAA